MAFAASLRLPDRAPWTVFLGVLGLSLIGVAAAIARSLLAAQPLGVDFLPMWAGARIAQSDPARVYDFAAVTEAQRWLLGPIQGMRPFAYPPSALLILAPLGALPFWPALALWTTTTLGAFAAAGARLARAQWLGAAFLALAPPAAIVGLVAGQSIFLVGALGMAAVVWLPKRPLLAGVLLGLAAGIKPTVLIAAPIALIAGGHWRALGAAVAAGGALGLASIAVFGVEPWIAWLAALPQFQNQIMTDPLLLKCVVTPTGLGVVLGLDGWMLVAWRAAFAFLGVCAAALAFRRSSDPSIRLVGLFGAGLLASPYAMNYDTALMLPAAVALLLSAESFSDRLARASAYAALIAAGFPVFGGAALIIFLGSVLIPTLAERKVAPVQA